MARHSIFVTATALYLIVIGCALSRVAPNQSTAAPPRPTEVGKENKAIAAEDPPYRAVGIQLQRVDWIEKYKKSIDDIADLGADTIKLIVEGRQENGSSNRIFIDMRMTPTPEQVGQLIKYAKSRNLRVVMMPIVLLDAPRGTEWRGRIAPEDWDRWWESYRSFLHHYSWIAQSYGVDILVVGSELVSTESQTEQWIKTIHQVREEFKGKLTYSSNWDHYTSVQFWDRLDFIGMNSYWTLGKNRDVSISTIESNWAAVQKDLFKFQRKIGKPIFLLEVGWCSMSNMAHEPWDYTKNEDEAATDPELQEKLYKAFFRSWYGRPELGGFSIWEWKPEEGGPTDRGYTPHGKPAEEVLRQWLARPWGDKPLRSSSATSTATSTTASRTRKPATSSTTGSSSTSGATSATTATTQNELGR